MNAVLSVPLWLRNGLPEPGEAEINHLVERRLRTLGPFNQQAGMPEPDAGAADQNRRKLGIVDGEFAVNDPELSAILIRSACIRFWHPRLLVEGAQGPEPTLDQMVDFCLAGLGQAVSEPERDTQNGVHLLGPSPVSYTH